VGSIPTTRLIFKQKNTSKIDRLVFFAVRLFSSFVPTLSPPAGSLDRKLRIESKFMTRQTEMRKRSLATIRTLLQTMITLASASLGFVAALAWNEAIKATFKKLLGEGDSLSALYAYAIVATLTAIIVLALLSWFAAKVGGNAAIEREVDG
jgi:Family of unknown function (DUF5654)